MNRIALLRELRSARRWAADLLGIRAPASTPEHPSVAYVSESVDWVIKQEGDGIARSLEGSGVSFRVEFSPKHLKKQIVHYGSVASLIAQFDPSNSGRNWTVCTYHHGRYGLDPAMDRDIDRFRAWIPQLDAVVASNRTMESRFLEWGVPRERLHLIPIGFDEEWFATPMSASRRAALRAELGIAEGAIVIGSFQKDGSGWGEGNEPKLVKGPDLLVEAVARLAKDFPVHCLLTGPSRGYVKQNLEARGIPHTHRLLDRPEQVVDYYGCLDLYLISSREEGGPKALHECFAAGVPLVSTPVGMVLDYLRDGENGRLARAEDAADLARCAAELLALPAERRTALLASARKTARELGREALSKRYESLYRWVCASPPRGAPA